MVFNSMHEMQPTMCQNDGTPLARAWSTGQGGALQLTPKTGDRSEELHKSMDTK